MLNEVQPDRPFMIYYAPGGTHSPHHPTREWVDKISAMRLFDEGWNRQREQIFANQKKLGIIPQDAKLTAWPKDLPQWETLSAEAKKLYIHQANIYAAYLAYTDHEIGRVIQAIEDAGKLDNTLIIYISGDNGASPEGTLHGLYSEFAVANGVHPTVEENMKFYDVWGTDRTYPHFAVGWAWAWDTPYQWTKEVASHFGGTRNGMAMAWPARIKDRGGIRHQFHHVIDIVPTILEAAGLPEPISVNGVAQRPIEGVSMAYTWDDAKASGRRVTQYFEMFGSRAIYHDGWIASAPPIQAPWDVTLEKPPADVMNGFKWELYNIEEDWTLLRRDLQRTVPRCRRCTEPSESFLHHHRRGRDPPRRRRGRARDRRRSLRRLWFLPAQGPAGVHLESHRVDAREVAGQGGARAGQAHARVRLEVRRPGTRQGRHRHSEGGRQGGGEPSHAAQPADHPPVGRDLQRRPRHRHAGGRPGLSNTVPLHWQNRQADSEARAQRLTSAGMLAPSVRRLGELPTLWAPPLRRMRKHSYGRQLLGMTG
jgi:hypothetical protein